MLHGIDRKDLALKQWCEEEGIAPERVLYVGNDVNDLRFSLVGWPVAVASAHDAVRGAAAAPSPPCAAVTARSERSPAGSSVPLSIPSPVRKSWS